MKPITKIAVCFGTRPEVIKLAMLIENLKDNFEVITVFTGQHHSLYEDVKHMIPNVSHSISLPNGLELRDLYHQLTFNLDVILQAEKPDMVVVQGDTASAYCAAYSGLKTEARIGHVEAGLRTNDIFSPFPEEINRQMISKIADFHWCPSKLAVENLEKERTRGEIINTGNTIIDYVCKLINKDMIYDGSHIVVTLHRRENKDKFKCMLDQINMLARQNPNINFVFPAHPTPNLQMHLHGITASNFRIVPPYRYEDFLPVLATSKGIITDSGGIQEEAVFLGKKTLICRNTTERQEIVNIGMARLIDDKISDNFDWLLERNEWSYENPYGDGKACDKIVQSLLRHRV